MLPSRAFSWARRRCSKASASGFGPLSYQWRRNGIALSDGGSVSGATTATLTIDPAAFTDAGSYDVLVTDSCTSVASNPAQLSVEFADVPVSSIFHADILTIATAGITAGCGGADYCPSALVSRAQMAVFLLKSEHGSAYVPPACIGLFADVPCPSTYANWIEQLSIEGVTAGCGGDDYCPDASVTRAQMAVFLLKTSQGSGYVPPPATAIFNDVPVGAFADAFIDDLYNRGIAGGCSASPLLYCPEQRRQPRTDGGTPRQDVLPMMRPVRPLALLAAGWLAATGALGGSPACPLGPFLQGQQFPAVTAPLAVALADFDGDGNPDAAVAGNYDPAAVLLGNGDGTFGAPIPTDGPGADTLVTGDFKEDGKVDFAGVSYQGVDVWVGNGDGTFETAVAYYVPGGFDETLLAVDLNHDDHLDLVVANRRGEIYVLLGAGDGTFSEAVAYPGDGSFAASGDFNGDGNLDIALAGDSVEILDGRGDGSFDPPRAIEVGGSLEGLAAGDVNNDGKLDLAVATLNGPQFGNGQVGVLLGNGDGTFQAAVQTFVGESTARVQLQDVDGDGNIDALVAASVGNFGGVFVGVLKGNGSASFAPVTEYLSGATTTSFAAADLDADGLADLVAANNQTNSIFVIRANGQARYRSLAGWETGVGVSGIVPGDFTGDGITDFIVSGYSNTAIRLFVGVGNGTFQAPVPISNDEYPPTPYAGDFNRDGKLDLGVTSNGGTRILLGNGDGTFSPSAAYAGIYAFAAADFTGDGILDLLASESYTGVRVVFGNGDGTFGDSVATDFGDSIYAETTFDINGDGKADLALYVSSPFIAGQVHVLMSNGNGTFTEIFTHDTALGPQGIAFAEVTGDTNVDLIAAEGSGGLSVFPGLGGGNFGEPFQLDAQYCSRAFGADFDGDGITDLVTTGASPSFFRGVVGGSFDPPAPIAVGGGFGVAIAPVVGAGPDLILSNNPSYYNSFFSVLFNSRLTPTLVGRSVLVGAAAVLRVSASGFGPLSYQWRRNGIALSDGGSVSGATTATLTIDPAAFTDAGSYDVLVTDSCTSVASNPARCPSSSPTCLRPASSTRASSPSPPPASPPVAAAPTTAPPRSSRARRWPSSS